MPLTPTTRASLLLRLCDTEDHEAWVEFVTLYEPVIYRLLRQHGLQDADARDVMQELLLAVSRSIDRWDPQKQRGSFRGWLRRVARNLVIDWLKQRGGGRCRQAVATCKCCSTCCPLPTTRIRSNSTASCAVPCFIGRAQRVRGEVHPATWEAFWETAVMGKSAADAATKLGMTVGAVRVASAACWPGCEPPSLNGRN